MQDTLKKQKQLQIPTTTTNSESEQVQHLHYLKLYVLILKVRMPQRQKQKYKGVWGEDDPLDHGRYGSVTGSLADGTGTDAAQRDNPQMVG